MKPKQQIKTFLSIAIGLVAILPLINLCHNSDFENFEKLFSTDFVESKINYALYNQIKLSYKYGDVIAGKDGFYFLGNDFGRVLEKTAGLFRGNNAKITRWVSEIKWLQDLFEKKGIAFIFVIAPNKHSVYPEKLPDWLIGNNILTKKIKQIAVERKVNLIDASENIINAKNDNYLYYKNDSHWNALGASISYLTSIETINQLYDLNLQVSDFHFVKEAKTSGDLARLLKIEPMLASDADVDFQFSGLVETEEVCLGYLNNNKKSENCEKITGAVKDVYKSPVIFENKNAVNNRTMLYLTDSFMLSNLHLYVDSFKKTYVWSYAYLSKERLEQFLNQYTPDIVIYQMVERELYTKELLLQTEALDRS